MKENYNNKHYYPEIDQIKGICILFIILLHSFSQYPINLREVYPTFFQFVCSFPLCLFFISSGFVFSIRDRWSLFLKKKATRLLLPMLVFSIIQIFLRLIFAPITRSQEANNSLLLMFIKLLNGEMYWFLYCLFLINCLNKVLYKVKYLIALLCLGISLMQLSIPNIATIPNILYFNVFFVFGIWLRKHYNFIKTYCTQYKVLLILLISCILSFTLDFEKGYLHPFIISMTIWCITLHIPAHRKLRHFGQYSLQYYLFHLLFMLPIYYAGKAIYEISNSYIIVLSTNFILAVSFTYLCVNIAIKLSKYRLFRNVLGM